MQPNFKALWDSWVASDYKKNLIPSIDRLDDYRGYHLDNIRLVTWDENNNSYTEDAKAGINTKTATAIIEIRPDGTEVPWHSIRHAARETGTNRGSITRVISGKQATANKSRWRKK